MAEEINFVKTCWVKLVTKEREKIPASIIQDDDGVKEILGTLRKATFELDAAVIE